MGKKYLATTSLKHTRGEYNNLKVKNYGISYGLLNGINYIVVIIKRQLKVKFYYHVDLMILEFGQSIEFFAWICHLIGRYAS